MFEQNSADSFPVDSYLDPAQGPAVPILPAWLGDSFRQFAQSKTKE
jgi:hypothetical protein